jgi:histidyl-tRNA synthetase
MALLKEKLKDVAPTMCTDCQRRAVTNPLRVLDCKVPEDQPIIETLPSISIICARSARRILRRCGAFGRARDPL